MNAKETTTIRVPMEQVEQGRNLLSKLVGARMGRFDWTHKRPTLGDLFILGMETAEAKLQKAK
jgi:hypothetical protein